MPPKRRRRFQGLYYHSSPPKVLPMNGQIANTNGRQKRLPDDLSVKLSTIRIWMHEKDIGKLTRVLWAGQGNRLRQQASTNPKVKRFLAAVPYVMNSIKDVHQAVIDNSLETLQSNLEPPVPPALVTCRDANGLNLIHKSAGLGHATILEYLITTWPDGVHETDITGKTPLHWAASAKNNMRCYTLLTQAGCDEEAVDYKMKTPSFYRHKPHEIERAFLTYVPEAPRVSPDVATDWEALSDESGDGKKLDIKIPELNGFGRHSNAESNENTSEAEMTEVASSHENEDEDAGEENSQPTAEKDHNEEQDEPETIEEDEGKKVQPAEENEKEESSDAKDDKEEGEEEIKDKEENEENDEAQDEKQQTETLNDTTENLTKDSEEDDKVESEIKESNGDKSENERDTEDTNDHKIESDKRTHETDEKISEKDEGQDSHEVKDEKTVEQGNKSNDSKDILVEKTLLEQEHEEKNKEASDEKTNEQENDDHIEEMSEENAPETNNKETSKEPFTSETIKGGNKTLDESDTNNKEHTEEQHKDESILEASENAKENNKNNDNENKDENDSKTLGETLVDIKDEVKDNVKYLANQIKNVFNGKDDKEDDQNKDNSASKVNETTTEFKKEEEEKVYKSKKDEKDDQEMENKPTANDKEQELEITPENAEKTLEAKENGSRNDFNVNDKVQDETKEQQEETEDKQNQQENEKINENALGKIATSNNNAQLQTETNIKSPTTSQQDSNSSNQNNQSKIQTPPSTAPKTPANESPKKGNDKTEEDENNNSSSKLTNEKVTINEITNPTEAITDEQFKELNKTLEEYKKEEENGLEETEKDIGDKLEEMADNLKENVKEMTDKIKHVFSTNGNEKNNKEKDKDKTNKLENESYDVVAHSGSTQKPASSKKEVKNSESSDDTADEDEEPQDEAENEVKNADAEVEKEKDNNNNAEPAQDAQPEPVSETKADDVEGKNDNEDNLDDEERDGEGSPTSSLAIEGFVQGDAEDNTVQSQTAAFVDGDEETRIQNIIASGDMEQLAQIVLNGDGQKLLNVEASEVEIQAFLKNVPNYMDKIRRVHEAARNGSLLNLQQALDRRKFAIAKDEISPNGATPLHVAVLFGNSDIVRYLSARFPETTTITDNDDRTALHYAAVINDNGHFYNVLLQLGANPKVVDKMGHTPEEYLGKEELKDTLNYSQLLKRFGAEELQEQLLSDQGQIENHSCEENPLFKTEQGKYLADNLADPLIKALTQVAQKRPIDPLQYLANYLQSYVASRSKNGRTITQAAIHSGSSETNSTILASSKQTTPQPNQLQRQTSRLNGHIKYPNADSIEEDSQQQIEDFNDDNDPGINSDAEMSKKFEERDEHGQSMLHFACARSHRRGGLIHLIEDAQADITHRDELYRTARDVALQANQMGNAKEIDRYVMSLAIVGDIKPFEHFAISGYDHIIDISDDNDTPILEVVEAQGLHDLANYLRKVRPLEELREELHQMIRENNVNRVKEIVDDVNGKWLIKAKNYYGRNAMHIAILKESIEIVEYFVNLCPEALKIGDNLERTPLHYAMGTNIFESISRILIQNGAKRTNKDLKGRQPSYYFMNKADILRLQEEEDENR